MSTDNFEAEFKATIPKLVRAPEYQGVRPGPQMLEPGKDFSIPEAQITQQLFRTPQVGNLLTLAYHAKDGTAQAIRRFVGTYQSTKLIENLRLQINHHLEAGPFLRQLVDTAKTDWIIWAQGGTWFRRPDWLQIVAQAINDLKPESRVAALAIKYRHSLTGVSGSRDPRAWFTEGRWHRGKHLRTAAGTEEPNGDCIHYPNPNFFIMSREAMLISGIPDSRIENIGLGVVIGEQLHQNDFGIKSFDEKQQYIVSDSAMTNLSGPPPWRS